MMFLKTTILRQYLKFVEKVKLELDYENTPFMIVSSDTIIF